MQPGSPTLVNALLYGRLDGVPPEVIFLFARTGLIHCFSASGFHLGMALLLARFAAKSLGPLCRGEKHAPLITLALSLALMTYFGVRTEWSSPMVRAFTFSALWSLAEFLEIRAGKVHAFFLSLLVAALLGRGSWLSFALSALGMGGLVFARPRNALTLALAPWAVTLPLTVYYFQLFSLSAPFWNLTLGVALAFTVLPPAILGLLLQDLGAPSAWAFSLAEAAMAQLVALLQRGDAWLGGAFWVEPFPFLLAAALLLAAVGFRKRSALALEIAGMGMAVPCLWGAPSLAMLDIGQGDAVFLRTSRKERLLVDTGPPGWKGREARSTRALERLGVGPLDHLLLSHLDRDHVGGTESLLLRHPVRQGVWLRAEHLRDPRALPLVEAAERSGAPLRFLNAAALPGVRCWLPPAASSNESSSICHAELAGGAAIWLTGDAGFASERWLLAQGPLPHAEFLKVAHHGSRFSSAPEFLRATGARVALVSVGRKNHYGHPAAAALRRLEDAGLTIRRTDREGTLRF